MSPHHFHPTNEVPRILREKSMKTLIYTLLMLVCGCRLAVESSHSTLIGAEKVSAIVEAYKAVWHSFYDEENFKEMILSESECDEAGRCLSFHCDYQSKLIQDRIILYIDEHVYSNWRIKARQILDNAGASEYIVDKPRMNSRIIAGSVFDFPAEVEEKLRRFDRTVEEGRLEDFSVSVELYDETDRLLSSDIVHSYEFYRYEDGVFSLPMYRLTKVEDMLSNSGERRKTDDKSRIDVSYANVEFRNFDCDYEDWPPDYFYTFKIKKDCGSSRFVRYGGDAQKAVQNIISNMVEIQGKNYCVCRFEVQQWEWEAIMGSNPSKQKGPHKPVENVSWIDCRHFISVLNSFPEVGSAGLHFRLPSYDEWMFICFGTSDILTQLTESEKDLEKKGWLDFNSSNQTHNVGMLLPNSFGLFDMIGNVWEYTSDSRGFCRYVRGGSYTEDREWYGLSTSPLPHDKFNDIGLRVFADKRTCEGNSYYDIDGVSH